MTNQNPYLDPIGGTQQQAQYQNPYLQQQYGGYPYGPQYYNGQPMSYANMPNQINMANALTDEEMKTLASARPASELNLNIQPTDNLRSMCTHKRASGTDPVHVVNDGSNDLYCEICNERWNADIPTREELQGHIDAVVSCYQNDKHIGNLPTDVVRDYSPIIPLLKKLPDIHDYAITNYNRFQNNPYVYNPGEVNSLNMFNSLMGGYTPNYYQAQPMGYQQPMNGQMMYQQPQGQQMGYQQQFMNQPVGGYQVANPSVNPMQATYGVNQAAPNQQFVGQANGMMNGGAVYQNPYQAQPMGYQQPMNGQMVYQQPAQNQVQGQQVTQQVAQPAQNQVQGQQAPQTEGQTVVSNNKIDL